MPLPSKKIVTYKARETPSNAISNVLMEHKVFIAAQSQNGDDVKWKINKLKFSQPGGGNWTDANPGLGAWVVTHAAPDDPVASDFTDPPVMNGTASPDSTSGNDLDYMFSSGSCSPVQGQMYGGDVVCAKYDFATTAGTIAKEDEDEPEEIDLEDDPI